MTRHIHNLKHLKIFRKNLRNKGTSAEAYLWTHLKNAQRNGRKFRRQQSIENYIVDFYCPQEQLIIELDGEVHLNTTAEEKDNQRTERLEALGLTVIRFENRMVFDLLPSVLREIESHFKD
jgi:very-short-patch-repair endonuclease